MSSSLISDNDLKKAAARYLAEAAPRIRNEQAGLPGVFDKWFERVAAKLRLFDADRPWEDSIAAILPQLDAQTAQTLDWDFHRLRLFLDRWAQGRFVDYEKRRAAGAHYDRRYGTEFPGAELFLTCQGAPHMMRWRNLPLMKTVFDYALYPLLLSELRPQSIFEIGSGSGASALWLADHLTLMEIAGHVHSVDIAPVDLAHPGVTFTEGDCAHPASLFGAGLLATAPHPWLVIEDAHHNVGAVLAQMHGYLHAGDYLLVEDSEIKHDDLAAFTAAHPGCYQVDTLYTDRFGRNATCAADSIFRRMR